MKKNILTILFAVMLLLTSLAVPVCATETETTAATESTETTALNFFASCFIFDGTGGMNMIYIGTFGGKITHKIYYLIVYTFGTHASAA